MEEGSSLHYCVSSVKTFGEIWHFGWLHMSRSRTTLSGSCLMIRRAELLVGIGEENGRKMGENSKFKTKKDRT